MTKLIAVATILAGVWEFFKACTPDSTIRLHQDLKALPDAEHFPDLQPEKQKQIVSLLIRAFIRVPIDIIEATTLVFATVYFPSPLRFYMAACFLLAFVTFFVHKKTSKKFYRTWMVLDCTFCAVVMILGPIFFL